MKAITDINIRFQQWNCYVEVNPTDKGVVISLLEHGTNEMIVEVSALLPQAKLDFNEVAIKDYGETKGIIRDLVENGIVSPPIKYIPTGSVDIPVCNIALVG